MEIEVELDTLEGRRHPKIKIEFNEPDSLYSAFLTPKQTMKLAAKTLRVLAELGITQNIVHTTVKKRR